MGANEEWLLGYPSMKWSIPARARTWDYHTDAWDWGRIPDRFVVRATDCAGNQAASLIAETDWGIVEDNAAGITYRGSWSVSNGSWFSGATTHYTTSAGSSFTVAVPSWRAVALVMATGPGRGSADIYVDGVLKKTVSTWATSNRNRVVIWQNIFAGGQHTIRVVNKATSGSPRIDIDAVLL